MSLQTVRVTAAATLAVSYPTRVRRIFYVNTGPAGTLELFDGATSRILLDIPSSLTEHSGEFDFEPEGIRFTTHVSSSVSNTLIDFNILHG